MTLLPFEGICVQPKVLSEGKLIDINDEGGEDRGALKELMLAKTSP